MIDDFYHTDLADRDELAQKGIDATALVRAAEAAFEARGIGTAFVVCPAKWGAKVQMLEAAGYKTAMLWSIKRNASAPDPSVSRLCYSDPVSDLGRGC